MPNALNPAQQNDASVVQASPDFGGFPGGVVPVSGGADNALAGAAPTAQAQQLGAPGQAPGAAQPGAQPNQVDAPSHEQTAALVYHTHELIKRMGKLMKDTNLGKKDAKSAIVDVALGFAQDGLGSVPQIVEGLKTLPKDPMGQRQWVEAHLMLAQLTQQAVLDHHAQANPPTLDWAKDQATHILPSKKKGAGKSSHIETIKGLADHYKPAAR